MDKAQQNQGDYSLQVYFRDISQIALLTRVEEKALFQQIKGGDPKARAEARALMIKSNLRLVAKIAHDYENCGLPMLDLISEGNIGLMKAVDRFNPRKGAKLSTYAAWWIKQSIRRALSNQSRTIRLPVHRVEMLSKFKRVQSQFEERFGREPTDEEAVRQLKCSIKRLQSLQQLGKVTASLDQPASDDSDYRLEEVVRDTGTLTPAEIFQGRMNGEMLQRNFSKLKPREMEILKLRFGLAG